MITVKTIERLCQYRRLLTDVQAESKSGIFSHEIAETCSITAVQVRRDLMDAGVCGHPKRGYNVTEMLEQLSDLLDNPAGEEVVLVGLGDLGRALLRFFKGYHPNINIVAAFDVDAQKTGRVIMGCRCHPVEELESVIRQSTVRVAIMTVPAAAAQTTADLLAGAGIRGIMTFSPVPVKVPDDIFLETIDIATGLEKATYMVRQINKKKERARQ